MKLSDKAYTILKWVTLICIPALATFYVALSACLGLALCRSGSQDRYRRLHSAGCAVGNQYG